MARDRFHYEFKKALEDEGWKVTHDPLTLKVGRIHVQIDLGAERLFEAEKNGQKIAVEIKTFGYFSFITTLYEAIGKYILYRNVMEMRQPERELFLAMPIEVYQTFLEEPVLARTIEKEHFKLIIYNEQTQTIEQWIK